MRMFDILRHRLYLQLSGPITNDYLVTKRRPTNGMFPFVPALFIAKNNMFFLFLNSII